MWRGRTMAIGFLALICMVALSVQQALENATNNPLSSNTSTDAIMAATSTASSDSTFPPTAQLAKPPSSDESRGTTAAAATATTTTTTTATNTAGQQKEDGGGNNVGTMGEQQQQQQQKAPIVTRQSPMAQSFADAMASSPPFAPLKPESKDEMFARIDSDGDNAITLQDYMNRDRYYVESVRTEFNDIDTNRDGTVTKAEFDAFVRRLDEQRKAAMLNASNFTLQKNDANKDGELSVDEIGTYINTTLQRSVAQLPEVFRQYDRDGNQRLNLDEFHELDFNFPWEKFPPIPNMMMDQSGARQVFFAANGPMRNQQQQQQQPEDQGQSAQSAVGAAVPVPPPFLNEQGAAVVPTMLPGGSEGANDPMGQIPLPNGGGYGSMPLPQPVTMMTMQRRFY